MTQDGNTLANVLYDFEYTTEEGRVVCIQEGEEVLIIRKTNDDWWQVIRDCDTRPFYAPKAYLTEISDVNANTQKSANETILFIANPLYSEYSPPSSIVNDDKKKDGKAKASSNNIPEGVTVIHIPGPPDRHTNNQQLSNQGDSSLAEDSFSEDTKLENTDDDYDELESNDDDGTKSTDSAYNDRLQKVIEDEGERSLEDENSLGPESPIYANFPLLSSISPPQPQPGDNPQKALFNDWAEYVDDSGRRYYYNTSTKETTWKPPRRGLEPFPDGLENEALPDAPPTPPRQPKPKLVRASRLGGGSHSSSTDSLDLAEYSPCTPPPAECFPPFSLAVEGNGISPTTPTLPYGWKLDINKKTGEASYLHCVNKEKWFSSLDDSGRIYYYAENGHDSHWELPEVPIPFSSKPSEKNKALSSKSKGGAPPRPKALNLESRKQKTHSLVLAESRPLTLAGDCEGSKSSSLPRGVPAPKWPCLQDGSMNVIKQGLLNKTLLLEGGKRLKKNWSSSYLILTDLFLLCYKDFKAAQGVNGGTKPEICFDLGGALINSCKEKSSRKNVFELKNVLGQQILLHDESSTTSSLWFNAIQGAIDKLPSSKRPWVTEEPPAKEKFKKSSRLSRTKSTKQNLQQQQGQKDVNSKSNDPSVSSTFASSGSGALPSPSDENCNSNERKKRIRDKLKNFFLRRPSMESLREKGILKDEPVFGCHLHNLCAREKSNIPKFVVRCVEAIEKNDVSADGLYRASGNLSQVQKIRFQVNQDNYSALNMEEDVHVLTGALKMFFRDMKEPLFPFDTFDNFLRAISLNDRQKRTNTLTELVRKLPKPNYETLKYLMHHLFRVTQQCDQNRMHVQNVAIVFGPTLMWPEIESTNLALDMMHQNQIMEFLLLEFGSIFLR